MYAFLMTLFIILCLVLAAFVLIQQGKGDMGVSNMQGGQMLFGASGGQNFFERATWIMGFLFILGSLGLAMLRTHEARSSVLEGVKPRSQASAPVNAAQAAPQASDADQSATEPEAELAQALAQVEQESAA